MSGGDQKKMWGGRFDRPPDPSFYEFERSWKLDRRLLPQELAVDRAWARALEQARLLEPGEYTELIAALEQIERRAAVSPTWLENSPAEDVHHFVEISLFEMLGPLGLKLHTGRSRNEMIATEFRLFILGGTRQMRQEIAGLAGSLVSLADRYEGVPMPGMTHLQHAQPILLSHWLLAHGEAFLRDADRMTTSGARADVCPMGSGALAGCAFPIDRRRLAQELGFSRASANSLDAISDRDFALEYLFALATLASHLSRLAEDVILFATSEFRFVSIPDEYSTGSSLMPQKKNPDAWELIRGKSGRVIAALVSALVTLKGLPLGYQRDLQEDKEPVFAAHDESLAMVRVAAGALRATEFSEMRLRAAAAAPGLTATEAADYLAARGVPFRQAHEIVGKAIREAEREGKALLQLPLERLKKFSPAFGADFAAALTVEAALARRNVFGGTAPEAVREALSNFRARLDALEGSL